jgi:DNA-binding transcriptional MerR regulator
MLLTVADAARRLAVIPAHVRYLEGTGKLPAVRTLSGQRIFDADDEDRLVAEREDQPRYIKQRQDN